MAKLTAKKRNSLSSKSFALPGRRYPIEDPSHARNALSRVSQNGTPEEKSEVRAKVHSRYPSIGKSHGGSVHGHELRSHGRHPAARRPHCKPGGVH